MSPALRLFHSHFLQHLRQKSGTYIRAAAAHSGLSLPFFLSHQGQFMEKRIFLSRRVLDWRQQAFRSSRSSSSSASGGYRARTAVGTEAIGGERSATEDHRHHPECGCQARRDAGSSQHHRGRKRQADRKVTCEHKPTLTTPFVRFFLYHALRFIVAARKKADYCRDKVVFFGLFNRSVTSLA